MEKNNIHAALRALFESGAETLAKKRQLDETQRAIKAREKLLRSKGSHAITGASVEALASLARKIEEELRWRSRALVTLFTEQRCLNCDSRVEFLTGIMVEQEHKTESGTRRLLRSVENHPLLPRRRETWVEHVEVCSKCYTDSGGLPVIVPPSVPERREETQDA